MFGRWPLGQGNLLLISLLVLDEEGVDLILTERGLADEAGTVFLVKEKEAPPTV